MLKSNNGKTVIVKANIVLKIMEDMQRLPFHLRYRFTIQKIAQLADTLPQEILADTLLPEKLVKLWVFYVNFNKFCQGHLFSLYIKLL